MFAFTPSSNEDFYIGTHPILLTRNASALNCPHWRMLALEETGRDLKHGRSEVGNMYLLTFHKHPEEICEMEVSEKNMEDAVDGVEWIQGILPVMELDHEILEHEK